MCSCHHGDANALAWLRASGPSFPQSASSSRHRTPFVSTKTSHSWTHTHAFTCFYLCEDFPGRNLYPSSDPWPLTSDLSSNLNPQTHLEGCEDQTICPHRYGAVESGPNWEPWTRTHACTCTLAHSSGWQSGLCVPFGPMFAFYFWPQLINHLITHTQTHWCLWSQDFFIWVQMRVFITVI